MTARFYYVVIPRPDKASGGLTSAGESTYKFTASAVIKPPEFLFQMLNFLPEKLKSFHIFAPADIYLSENFHLRFSAAMGLRQHFTEAAVAEIT
ncbi:hypothetical protein [Chitinophaga solisilvae]|uniref:hypothetical protein n=1 Tax=Chitinophaga solisilvae TaxID=1233460 RepID=UPI00136CE58B|nr:hypothetical protein [Chitinophaga solisilvae]